MPPLHVRLLAEPAAGLQRGGGAWPGLLRQALVGAGARVEIAQLPASKTAYGYEAAGAGRRLGWRSRRVWTLLASGYRAVRRLGRWVRTQPAWFSAGLAARLAGADLVVVASPAAARFAARCGVPRARLWLLAAPDRMLFPAEASGYGAALAQVAPAVAGFLVESEAARDSVERAASPHRVEVRRWPAGAAVPGGRDLLAALPAPRASGRPRRSVLVAGYDLKFATELATQLDRRAGLAVTVDDWPALGTPNRDTGRRLRTVDAVFAEWLRTSAVWLSQRKRPGQFLAVRLHRFELDYPYPGQLAIDNVDAVVYIAPLFGRRIRAELGWPAEKLVYIPNYLDVAYLDRAKLPDARFAIGFVGLEWSRKRFDLALDLLAEVRRHDPRFRLVVRSALPWHNPYVWQQQAERDYAARCFARLERDPWLRDAVIFEPPGPDMARWYRRIGHIVSTSDAEGSHMSVAEAMASGAVPVIRPWPGADELYDRQWVYRSPDQAVAAVLAGADADAWAARAQQAKAEVGRSHDPAAVVAAWADLLRGEVSAARKHFAGWCPSEGSRQYQLQQYQMEHHQMEQYQMEQYRTSTRERG